MVILGQRWAEHYMKIHPEKRVQVTGGGSGTGIAADKWWYGYLRGFATYEG